MKMMQSPQARKVVEAVGRDYDEMIQSGVNYYDSRMSSVTFFTNWNPVYGTYASKEIVRAK
jgi:hypothetical protein